ncbi:MAG TPA: DMT family transporter [Gemmatales bacterium]|nr:DMT family transporter [Gemmatales bacterium]HMP58618.1 DMT family transporter [Gemmatales bacterium]
MADVTGRALWRGRLLVLTAAALWSLNGLFGKLLTKPNPWNLGEPPVEGLHIAFYRCLFAGLLLAPLVPRSQITWRPLFLGMMLCFAAMNAMFVYALTLGTAATALVLQYTAPTWILLLGLWQGQKPHRSDVLVLVVAMLGVGVIVQDGIAAALTTGGPRFWVVLLGLGSGITFGGVLLFLKKLHGHHAILLTVLNQFAAALLVLPFVFLVPQPTWPQLGVLVVFGVVQLGLPYVLMAQGLRHIPAQEAGLLGLIEPLLNPLWAYLVATEIPERSTQIGGVLILLALILRYAPWRRGAAVWTRTVTKTPAVTEPAP